MMAGAAAQQGRSLADILAGEPAWAFARESVGNSAAKSVADHIIIAGIAIDHRQARPGDLFLACKGLRHNGMDYIHAAVKAGAIAVAVDAAEPLAVDPPAPVPVLKIPALRKRAGCLISRFFDEPSRAIQLFGVTGTNGKTTVAYLIARALSAAGRRAALIGTLGHGPPAALEPSGHTTPDPLQLHSLLAGWRGRFDSVALEVSSHALDQGRVAGLLFDIAVFTNLSRDHLDYHADMDAYAAAKFQLFEAPELKQAIVNIDDQYGLKLRARLGGEINVVACSANAGTGAEVICRACEPLGLGYRLSLHSPWGEARIATRLPGRFNIDNNLAAFAALCAAGIPARRAARALSAVSGIPGRMECFSAAHKPLLVVDYAHTPDALQKALLALRPHCRGRLYCVFGCGGERDSGKRPQMGALAAALADHVILTSDNPRSEPPQQIIRQILAGIKDRRRVTVEEDRSAAVSGAFANAAPEDVVLIAGKGHESTQTVGGMRLPFSDRELARSLTAVAA